MVLTHSDVAGVSPLPTDDNVSTAEKVSFDEDVVGFPQESEEEVEAEGVAERLARWQV